MSKEEIEKCKDPVYFYENYMTVDGKPAAPLTNSQKHQMRTMCKAREEERELLIINARGGGQKVMYRILNKMYND
jgi:hypothetical protein